MAQTGNQKIVNLALQGGGAHGAFTWGVLDRILDDGRIKVEAISGTSAGAMNAAVLADGYVRGGPESAREALETFWRAVSKFARTSPVQRTLFDVVMGNWSLDHSPGFLLFDVLSRFASPYDVNPFDINPLRDLVAETIDFERVHACQSVALHVAATNVHTGKIRIFSGPELTPEALMASACLPHIFRAVEIEGVPYWDGGYMGNPPLFPLFGTGNTSDVILVQINPVAREVTPTNARDILNRLNEITFNSTLLRELRAIDFVTRLIEDGKLDSKEYTKIHMHRITAAEELAALSASSKLNAEWRFLQHLRDIGRNAADRWLDAHFDALGVRSTLDLRTEFQ